MESYVIGLAVLAVLVLLLIVAIILLTLFFLRRLRRQSDRLSNIEEVLQEKDTPLRKLSSKTSDRPQTDSAVDVSELDNSFGPLDRNNTANPKIISIRSTKSLSVITRRSVHCVTAEPNRPPPLPAQVIHLTQVTENNPMNEQTTADDIKFSTSLSDDFMGVYESYFKQNVVQNRPTSVLCPADSENKTVQFETGMFVHKEIDTSGGEMYISGVKLKIPKGAVEKKTKFTLGITWDMDLFPDLTKREALLSPLVVCQPSISFKKPVELNFPHCADKINVNWKWKIIKRGGDLTQQSSWNSITLEDYDQRVVSKSSVTIHLHHFTLFALIGTSKDDRVAAKAVQMVAFSSVLQRTSLFTSKLYCINDYGRDIQDIRRKEFEVNRKVIDSPVPLLVYDNGENVVVKQTKEPEEWKLMGKKSMELDFELVWHSCNPNCAFAYKPQSTDIGEIVVEYTCHQTKHEETTSSIQIVAEAPKLLPAPFDKKQSEMTRNLVVCLDPATDNNNDWRALAEKMGMKFDKIRWIEEQSGSPTELLLKLWMDEGRPVEQLRSLLLEMNRDDAVSVVDKYQKVDKL